MCLHTPTYVSASCGKCMCVLILLYNMCVRILQHMYPHPAVLEEARRAVQTVYVSHMHTTALCVSAYYYMCVLILLYFCPQVPAEGQSLYLCPHTTTFLLYVCLHTTVCLQYVCPHTTTSLLCVCLNTTMVLLYACFPLSSY